MTVCPKCGLPKDICVCEAIAKETLKIIIGAEKKKFGKVVTTISGVEDVDLEQLVKQLKAKFACGGTLKEDSSNGKLIELQGDHRPRVKEVLVEMGFAPERIVVK